MRDLAIAGLFLLQRPLDFAFANREFAAYLPASSRLFPARNLLYVERAGRRLKLRRGPNLKQRIIPNASGYYPEYHNQRR